MEDGTHLEFSVISRLDFLDSIHSKIGLFFLYRKVNTTHAHLTDDTTKVTYFF